MNRDAIPLVDAVEACKDQAFRTGDLSPSTAGVYFADWDDLVGYATAHGARAATGIDGPLLRGFLGARDRSGGLPANASKHRRRNSTRRLFKGLRVLDLVPADRDPTGALVLPARTSLEVRPLTDDEIVECEWASRRDLSGTRYPAVWALAETGATVTELADILVNDIDLDEGVVLLGGTRRTHARPAFLTEWGQRQLARHLTTLSPHPKSRLVNGGDLASRKAAVSNVLRRILTAAGLADERDVTTESVRAWVGRRLRDQGVPVEQITRRLGMRSIDRVMVLIGEDWMSVED